MRGHTDLVDPRVRTVGALISVVVTAGVSSGCAEWQAEVARERGMPFGNGEYEGRVVAQSGLNVRSEPSTDSDSLATLTNGTPLRITCRAEGETIEGNSTWYKLGFARWVSAEYVSNVGAAPERCD